MSSISFAVLSVLALLIVSCKSKDNVLAPPPPGPAWVTYRHETSRALLDNKINGLAVGLDGSIWVATDSGASNFASGNWTFIRDTLRYSTYFGGEVISSYKVNAIVAGRDGSIWFGLAGGYVKRYHKGAPFYVWQEYKEPDIQYGVISGLASDLYRYGDIWVATPSQGISRYIPSLIEEDQGVWQVYQTSTVPQLLTDRIASVAYNDFDNSVWFGSYLGVNTYNTTSGWSKIELPLDQQGTVVSIAFDQTQYVWFAKSAASAVPGVTRYDKTNAQFTSYTSESTGGILPDGGVNAVVTNYIDTHWFATNAGLVRLKDTTWTRFTTSNTPELPSDNITSLVIDRKKNLWIGTANGIAVYNEEGTRF